MSSANKLKAFVQLDLMVWKSLFYWITRRSLVEQGALKLPYVKGLRTILWVFVGLSALEVPIMDLILRPWPWPWIRYPFLALGIWGVIYMIGFVAAYEKLPHTLSEQQLTLRVGPMASYSFERDEIKSVRLETQSYETNKGRQLLGDRFALLIAGTTNVTIEFANPQEIEFKNQVHQIRKLSFYLDEPSLLTKQF